MRPMNVGTDEAVRRIDARLSLQEVNAALGELPVEQRAALLLVTVDGVESHKEAADIAEFRSARS